MGIGFGLNLLWENLQAPLYAGFISLQQHFWLCFIASIGDAFVIAIFYLIIAAVRKDALWLKKSRVVDLVLAAGFGGITAFGMEYWAVTSGKWGYLPSMPLLSYTPVGLSPFLQLLILAPLTFFLARLTIKKDKSKILI